MDMKLMNQPLIKSKTPKKESIMTFMTNKEFTRQNINAMTEKFLSDGGEIKKLKPSKTQESYVANRIPRRLLRG